MRKKFPKPRLLRTEAWCDSCLVTYPISYDYNGGIIIDDKWYEGVEVPPPLIPAGYILKGIGVGLNLNARPPEATMYLKKVDTDAPIPELHGGYCQTT